LEHFNNSSYPLLGDVTEMAYARDYIHRFTWIIVTKVIVVHFWLLLRVFRDSEDIK
jgi:hypothetical protein